MASHVQSRNNSKQASKTSASETSTIVLWMDIFFVGASSDITRITVCRLGQFGLAQLNSLTDTIDSSLSGRFSRVQSLIAAAFSGRSLPRCRSKGLTKELMRFSSICFGFCGEE